jgi:hypothetical protein
MLFRETVAVYCENHTEHTYTVWTEYRVFIFAVEIGRAPPRDLCRICRRALDTVTLITPVRKRTLVQFATP